jgi:hypothetical protein
MVGEKILQDKRPRSHGMKSRPLSIPRAIRLAFEIIATRGAIGSTLPVAPRKRDQPQQCVGSVSASLNAGTESFAALLKHHCGDFWLNADQGHDSRPAAIWEIPEIICARELFSGWRKTYVPARLLPAAIRGEADVTYWIGQPLSGAAYPTGSRRIARDI